MDLQKYLSDSLRVVISQKYPNLDSSQVICDVAKSGSSHDFQTPFCLKNAKALGLAPMVMAQNLVEYFHESHFDFKKDFHLSATAPGFLNLTLQSTLISKILLECQKNGRPQVESQHEIQRVIIDYSSPNIAKELHVGHLRSTILGDALARFWEEAGHDVLRLNHLGDWGTAFGMLLSYLERHHHDVFLETVTLSDLMVWYQAAKAEFDSSPEAYESAKQSLILLQSGDQHSLRVWKRLCEISQKGYAVIYQALQISPDLIPRGESFYQPWLEKVVDDAKEQGLLTISDGASCLFLDGFTGRDGQPQPLIIRKSDGGFNYASFDLAAIYYRTHFDRADLILYVTDNGQRDHFDMVFAGAVALGYAQSHQLVHVPFGLVQNEQKKRFKTRSGDVIRLQDLLDEGYARAYAIGEERSVPDCDRFAKVVGYGAIKYADLSLYRLADYVFNWDQMLSFQGNTVVYLLYTVVRCRSIIRKAALQNISPAEPSSSYVYHESEKNLILHLAMKNQMISKVLAQSAPHYCCDYLYELSAKFNHFFRDCPILKSEEHAALRLLMVHSVDRTMTHLLKLLGIDTVDEM